jgi:Zn-dependent protease with chaperone function
MILLPILYLLLIAGVAAGIWWHVGNNQWLLESPSQWELLAYIAPAFVGITLVFFMVKPVLARPARRVDPIPISPDEEPVLFAFIDAICRQVRAPLPHRVQVDCQVNASASFVDGRFGVFSRDLALTIGLPLVAGLSMREFGGVLAHEFGHFAQGGGLRLTGLVRGINGWFARVVFERDRWDETLEKWSKEGDFRFTLIVVLARGAIWVSRLALSGLMMAGHAISCFMMRQMEYDADSYEIKLAGSDAFVRTMARLRQLNAGAQLGYMDVRHGWEKRELPSNLPAFLNASTNRLPPRLLEQLLDSPTEPTRHFDTHPSDADRVRFAGTAAATGVLAGGDVPATELFRNFEAIGVRATRHHYSHDLGLDLSAVTFVGANQLIEESEHRAEQELRRRAFFQERLSVHRPLRLPLSDVEALDNEQVRQQAIEMRGVMEASDPELATQYRQYEDLALKRAKALSAEERLAAGAAIRREQFGLSDSTFESATSMQAWAQEQQCNVALALDAFESAAARRLACGLILAARRSSPDARPLGDVFNLVAGVMPDLDEAQLFFTALRSLTELPAEAAPSANVRIASLGTRIGKILDHVGSELAGPCPSAITSHPMSVAAWCGIRPDAEGAVDLTVLERAPAVYSELLGRIVTIARAIEDESPALSET